jgi:hypothetical protein
MQKISTSEGYSAVVETMVAGEKPSYADLQRAFLNALAELRRISANGSELATWIERITGPHLEGDPAGVRKAIDGFVKKHCKVIDGKPVAPTEANLLQDVTDQLNAGGELSQQELKAALSQSMTELQWATMSLQNIGVWLEVLVTAHSEHDQKRLAEELENFKNNRGIYPFPGSSKTLFLH